MSASMKTRETCSSSDSEDDEASQRIREAAIECSDIFQGYKGTQNLHENDKKKVNESNLPSLRPSTADQTSEGNTLQLTVGVRQHLAKKLSEVLDRQLDLVNPAFRDGCHETNANEGVKLFLRSSVFCTGEDDIPRPQQRKRQVSVSSSSGEDERLKEAAVSHDFIIGQSRVEVTDEGQGQDVEVVCGKTPKVDQNKPNTESDSQSNPHKKKKKKKKKHKCDEEKE